MTCKGGGPAPKCQLPRHSTQMLTLAHWELADWHSAARVNPSMTTAVGQSACPGANITGSSITITMTTAGMPCASPEVCKLAQHGGGERDDGALRGRRRVQRVVHKVGHLHSRTEGQGGVVRLTPVVVVSGSHKLLWTNCSRHAAAGRQRTATHDKQAHTSTSQLLHAAHSQ